MPARPRARLLAAAAAALLALLAAAPRSAADAPADDADAAADAALGAAAAAERARLAAACVPQSYPKQGALLAVTLPGRLVDVQWAPASADADGLAKVAFALLADAEGYPGGPLWRSDYYGRAESWRDASAALRAALPVEAGPDADVGVVAVVAHKAQQKVLFQGRGRFHWASADGGATMTALATPGNTLGGWQDIRPHPRQPEWLLARARRDACAAGRAAPGCGADLFVSKDFGGSWANLTEASAGRVASFRDFAWAAELPLWRGKPPPDEGVLATAYPGAAERRGLYSGWDKDLRYVVTTDLFRSPHAQVMPCGNLFEVVGGKVFLAVPSECPVGPDGAARRAPPAGAAGRAVTLYISDPQTSDFVEACLPTPLEDDGYNIVHTHGKEGAHVLADHAEPGSWGPAADAPTADAYAPSNAGALHTLALAGVYRREFVTDFSRVEGLPGVYVANQVDPAAGGAARGREAALLRTRLSLTGGASWRALAPPAAFRFPRCNACAPGAAPGSDACALHLHGPTSWFAPEGPHPNLYTLEAAPGLALATGNVGAHLDFSPDADCTFLSRDGGATWEDVADNTAIYEVGAAGSIIAMAAHRSEGPADAVRLSLDAGACWHTVRLPEPLLVDNIRVDPSGGGRVFLVHGQACARSEARPACTYAGGGGGPPGKLFSVDVRELLGADFRECDAADGSADFEAWAPPTPGGCLLGAARAARRRSRDAFCVSPPAFSAALAPPDAPCACAADTDLECEFGFARPPGGGANATCAPMPGVAPADACPRLLSSGYRTSSTHTRLVHGDACAGVGALIPDTDGQGGKPGASGGGSGGGGAGGKGGAASAARRFFVFLLLAGAGGAAAALAWAHCLAPAQREAAVSAAMPALAALAAGAEAAFGFVVDAWDWARARLRERGILRGGDDAYGYGYGGGAPGGAYEPLAGGGGLDLAAEDAASPTPFARGGEP